jgi:Mg2+/citrate symporter
MRTREGANPIPPTISIGYVQVFQLAWQLSPRERKRLAKEIVSRPQKCSRKKWKQILSSVPTLSAEDAQELEKSMKNFRKEFNDAFECRRLGLVGSD